MSKLNAKLVASIKAAGMHGDGQGLYLHVSSTGAKSWILRATIKGEKKRREIGLGALVDVSLAEARTKARVLRSEARAGRNPIAYRDKDRLTFDVVAEQYHASLAPTFRSDKHAAQWLSSMKGVDLEKLRSRKIDSIGRDDILSVLLPIWTKKHPTAKRIKQRIESIFDWAIGKGQHPGPNPVDGVLKRALPPVKAKPKHHHALPWCQVPQFITQLGEREAIAARCLELVILTAVRSGEARGATWGEFNIENKIWIIPAERMKAEHEHRVPLSDAALSILGGVRGLDAEIVFPSPKLGSKPLSVNAFRPLLARMGREGLTVHGFRSTFRDWAAESAHADRAVAEAALAHRVAGVEGAYFRSDLFERRRELMDAWGRYVNGTAGDVVELVRA